MTKSESRIMSNIRRPLFILRSLALIFLLTGNMKISPMITTVKYGTNEKLYAKKSFVDISGCKKAFMIFSISFKF